MVLVVCDSTPLIYLARLGRFDLLRKLHESVLLPPAVWHEVAVVGSELPEGQQVQLAAKEQWLRVESPRAELQLRGVEVEDLDLGEKQALQLAIEQHALLIIDEALGRAVATRLGLKVTGTVGLLIRARREGLLMSLRTELDRLRSETNFRMSEILYRDALRSVGELPV